MTLNLIDHLFVILLALVFPITDYFSIRKKAQRIHNGETELRMGFYRGVIAHEWIYVVAALVTWFALGRGAAELGLVPSLTPMALAGYVLTLAIVVLLVLQARMILGNPDYRARMRKELGWLGALMPRTVAERDGFDLVSITAGICEEVLFRGFITAYLMSLLGTPFWAAAIGSSVLFGLAHMYQGPQGMLKCLGFGLIMALIYGMTGSLWAPMIAHAAMDIISGRIAFGSLGEDAPENSSPQLAA
jgi:membrane protease YdiL (CAAX protease family)